MPLFLRVINCTDESAFQNSTIPYILENGAIVIDTAFSERASTCFQEIPEVIKRKEDLIKNWFLKQK